VRTRHRIPSDPPETHAFIRYRCAEPAIRFPRHASCSPRRQTSTATSSPRSSPETRSRSTINIPGRNLGQSQRLGPAATPRRRDLIRIRRCALTGPEVTLLAHDAQTERDSTESMLRKVPIDAGGDLQVQRPLFEEVIREPPLPGDILLNDALLGGVPILEIAAPGAEEEARVLYFHDGAFALRSPRAGAGLGEPHGLTSPGQGAPRRISARPRATMPRRC
jgi:hypothetical protein